jgi:magnesium chelatase subunit I
LALVNALEIDSHRAEYTLFEAARAYASADGRTEASIADIRAVAPLALRLRRSDFMLEFVRTQQSEDDGIRQQLDRVVGSAQA